MTKEARPLFPRASVGSLKLYGQEPLGAECREEPPHTQKTTSWSSASIPGFSALTERNAKHNILEDG